jgi:hypothetical protein
VLIGQENDGWVDGASYMDVLVKGELEPLLDVYRGFNIADSGPESFGRYVAYIRDAITGKRDATNERAMLYSNLFKLNQGMVHMSDSSFCEEVLSIQADDFQKEISILKPDVVIFLTGPNYDKTIKAFYPEPVFAPFGGYSERELAVVSAADLPRLTFRTCHPGNVNQKRDRRIRYYDAIINHVRSTSTSVQPTIIRTSSVSERATLP